MEGNEEANKLAEMITSKNGASPASVCVPSCAIPDWKKKNLFGG